MATILGIDPGASGGFACITASGEIEAHKISGKTEHDIAQMFDHIVTADPVFAYIERVGPNRIAAKGERRQGASTMFAFGRSYGFLRGVLVALGIPFEEVLPQKWLPEMGLRGIKGETETQKKNRHKAKAQRLWPDRTITHDIADAMLIAEYGRRLTAGAHMHTAIERSIYTPLDKD